MTTKSRFSSLAALTAVVGSSLVSHSAHAQSQGLLAAPDSLSAPLLAAQAPPSSDPSAPPPAQGPTGTPGAPTAGATITLGGTGAPGSPQTRPQVDAPAAQKKSSGMTFYDRISGSSIFMQTGATLGTFFKGYQADYNPTVQTYVSIAPRFAINKDWQIRALVPLQMEWTNSDTTTKRNELELYDSSVQLYYRGIPALGGKVKLLPYVGVGIPTSKDSRARTLRFSPSLGVQASVPIEHFLGGEAIIIGRFAYARPIYRQTTPQASDDRKDVPVNCLSGGSDCSGQLSGSMNARDSFSTFAIFAPSWGDWSPGALMVLSNQIAYKPSMLGASDTTVGQTGQKSTTARSSTYFALWLDYAVTDWLTPELGYQQRRSALNSDGGYGNPFFDKRQEQIVYLGANIQVDSLLKKITGEDAKAGIVRAKNKNPNPLRFY